MKILQILHHSLTPFNLNVNTRLYEGDWHYKVAKRILSLSNKYEIECWRPEKSFKKKFCRLSDDQIKIRIFPSFYINSKYEFSVPLFRELNKIIKSEDILVHFHGIYNFQSLSLISLVGKKIPVVMQSHGGLPAFVQFRRSNSPLKHLHLIKLYPERFALRYADMIYCLDQSEKEYLSEKFGDHRVKISTMGIDFNQFKPMKVDNARKLLNLNYDCKYILYVGRLTKRKGIDYLLVAFSRVQKKFENTQLIIIGEGDYKRVLKGLITSLNIEKKVKFIGYQPNKLLPLWYNAVDVVVHPSLSETFGLIALEALACEKAFIGTNVGQIPQIIKEFNGGIVVPPGNSNAILDAIFDVFSNKYIFNFNRQNAAQTYSWNKIISHTLRVFDSLNDTYY